MMIGSRSEKNERFVKLLVISKLLAFHGAVCNVISCTLQGMSQLVLG